MSGRVAVLAGAGGALLILGLVAQRLFGGSHDDAATQTRFALGHVSDLITTFRRESGRLPHDLDELLSLPAASGEAALQRKSVVLSDRWGRAFFYRRQRDGCGYVLFSLGADGRIGGHGQDADLEAVCDQRHP